MFKSIRNLTILLVLSYISFSCKEECLDMQLIDQKTVEMESWFTNPEITSKNVSSNISISDEAILTHEFNDYGDSIWDDCENITQSFRNTVSYQFFNFPFNIVTEHSKQGEENGFKFIVTYNNYNAIYNFTSQQSTTNNTINLLSNYEINSQNYPEVFKINFNQSQEANEIKKMIYIKNLGIIYIELNNGTILNLE